MKRDMGLVREVLLRLEDLSSVRPISISGAEAELQVDGFSPE